MSYGRSPYYIWAGKDNVTFVGPDVDASIPYDALAQFVARMAARGDDEIQDLIKRGVALKPDDFTNDFKVTVTGGFK